MPEDELLEVSTMADTRVAITRKILEACPTCGGALVISEVQCTACGTEVRSAYQPCPFCRLTTEQTNFILLFVQLRGNLTEVEKALGVSYPTIRGKLDEVLRTIAPPSNSPARPPEPMATGGQAETTAEPLRSTPATPFPPAPTVQAPVAQVPATPPQPPRADQREILARIALGKITAAQGLAALRAPATPGTPELAQEEASQGTAQDSTK